MQKGIIMAGGSGTRLWPMTQVISKQLLPVYDKPMIYYPLTTLMEAGIRDILIVSTPHDVEMYRTLLKDGTQWGINLSYVVQANPGGIAEAFLVGEKFIGNDNVTLILGDNIFYGTQIHSVLTKAINKKSGASIFAYYVQDPERYGVIVFDEKLKPFAIEEKPQQPKSHYAVTGLYSYDNQVVHIAKELKPSARGELEITDINNAYLNMGQLNAEILSRGIAWLDTGTCASLLDAAHFIHTVEERQGLKVGCPEEAAWHKGFIDDAALEKLAQQNLRNTYGKYLLNLLEHKKLLEKMES
jgi:glucose-1-phosphate thymidylyltransferase